jgi:methylenetetrahydrofolate reductase (NADPH)
LEALPLQANWTAGASLKTFKDAVRNKDFAISAEIFLRPETDADSLRVQADVLREHVDAILVTDNQYGQLHLSPLAAASILLDHGVDPIVQITSRNRNRIALISDILGAGALGVTSLLLVAGERAATTMKPRPKPVLDLTAIELIRTANTVKEDEKLTESPDFFVGGHVAPVMPKKDWQAKQLREKIAAGAQFVQTHICMDTDLLRHYCRFLVENKITQRISIIGTVAVLESAEDAQWLREHRPNVLLTPDIVQRMESATDPREEGIRICGETIRAMSEIPGLDGVDVVAVRDLAVIPDAIKAAGLDG